MASSLTPAERSSSARLAVLESWGKTPDRAARTAPARSAFIEKFRDAVRAEFPGLGEEQVDQMADARRRAHYERLSFLSAKARRERQAAS